MEHLRTDHLHKNLGKRTIAGGFVTGAAQGVKFVLSLVSAMVLARLLKPSDFGLVGMALAVTGLLELFKDAGLSTATVQRADVSQAQVSSLFWLNAALGGVVCLVTIALAHGIAWFYHDSRLVAIMILLSVTFPLTGFSVQHRALLSRQMRYQALAIVDVVSLLVSVLAGVGLALLGCDYWSLVGMQLCLAAATLVLTWWTSGWRPTMLQRQSGVTPLLSFGAHLTVAHLVARLAANSDSLLIGRSFGAAPLGLYSRAQVLLARPVQQLFMPLEVVLLPVLSRLQADPELYRRAFIRAYDALALVTFSFAALCLVLAEPLVLLLLGSQWSAAVPLFAGFSFVALYLPLSVAPSWLFMSQGRGRELLNTYLILGVTVMGACVAGLPWGPLGVLVSLATTGLAIRLPILYFLAGRCGPVRSSHLWGVFFSHLPCWGAVYAASAVANAIVSPAAPIVQVLTCVPIGLAAGAGVALSLKRPRMTLLYAWARVRSALVRQSGSAA